MPSLTTLLSVAPPFVAGVDQYDPVWLRCLEATRNAIRGLRLTGVGSDSVIMLEQPLVDRYFDNGDGSAKNTTPPLPFPGVIVWPWQQEAYNPAEGTNLRDEIGYPVAVSFVERGSGRTGDSAMVHDRAAIKRHMVWREQVSRRFRFASWPEIPEIEESNVSPNLYAIPSLYQKNDIFHGAMVIVFASRETRDQQ